MDSLKCLNNECINLLHNNKLLQPLIKSELKSSLLSEVQIEKEFEISAINEFKSKFKITNETELEDFLVQNDLDHKQFNDLALFPLRTKKYSTDTFGNKSEARFLERKDNYDMVIYSMIRVGNLHLCRELFFKVSEKEADFGEIASRYSEGFEKTTRGIIGPHAIAQAHPSLRQRLRKSKIGEVSKPFQVNNNFLITRVESFETAKLDNSMKEKMCEELFDEWLNSESIKILKGLISQIKPSSQSKGELS